SQATTTPSRTTCTLLDTIGCSPRVSYLTLDNHNGKYEQREPSYPPALEGQQTDPQPRLFRSCTSSVYPSVPRDEKPPVFQDFRHDPYTDLPPRNEPNEKLEPSVAINKAMDNLEELVANIQSSIINHVLAYQLAMDRSLARSLKQYYLERHHQDSYFRGKDQSHDGDRFNLQKKRQPWKKKCYNCRKYNCW
ncbi:BgTH12-04783, partial [Blumeria graminis f. sp. triticale]